MTTRPKELQLSGILARHLEQVGSYLALARAINEGNGLGASQPALVDRRKLKQIVLEDAKLVLSLRELRAINRYLVPFGEGLAKKTLFFEPASVIVELARTGEVTFLLGSKPEAADFRVNFSHWDVVAMAEAQREAYLHRPNLQFDFRDVLLHDSVEGARKDRVRTEAHFSDDGPSLVCLGSTRALHATELMLAKMFDVDPFDPRQTAEMPFHFVWAAGLDHVFPSSFHLSPAEAGLRPDARALEICPEGRSEVLADTFTRQREGDTYGVVVVQRRRTGHLWICLAGVTGLGTLAAARALRDLSASLVPDPGKSHSPVFWMPIRARVSVFPSRPAGRQHELGKPTPLAKEPYRWPV
jgi:hypothetical protein